jgi:alpha-tubulin suppressor-like RCC1 family protein
MALRRPLPGYLGTVISEADVLDQLTAPGSPVALLYRLPGSRDTLRLAFLSPVDDGLRSTPIDGPSPSPLQPAFTAQLVGLSEVVTVTGATIEELFAAAQALILGEQRKKAAAAPAAAALPPPPPTPLESEAAALSLPLPPSTTLLSWGGNANGALGVPGLRAATGPVRVVCVPQPPSTSSPPSPLTPRLLVSAIAAGDAHCVAVTSSGAAFSWGANEASQLGLGVRGGTFPRPTEIGGLCGHNIVAAAAGSSHTLFLSARGDVFVCGYNGRGQLGTGGRTGRQVKTPVALSFFSRRPFAWSTDAGAAAGGGGAGAEEDTELAPEREAPVAAAGPTAAASDAVPAPRPPRPALGRASWRLAQPVLMRQQLKAAAADEDDDDAADDEGGERGNSGEEDALPASPTPKSAAPRRRASVVSVARRSVASLASLRSRGYGGSYTSTLAAPFGNTSFSPRPDARAADGGHADDLRILEALRARARPVVESRPPPQQEGNAAAPASAEEDCVVEIAAGGDCSFALTQEGRVFAFGRNDGGQLGVGGGGSSVGVDVLRPLPVQELRAERVVQVAVGREHALFVTAEGHLWACGRGAFYRLGQGSHDRDVANPARVRGALESRHVVAAACGAAHSLAVTDEGDVFGFGDNAGGQLVGPRDAGWIGKGGGGEDEAKGVGGGEEGEVCAGAAPVLEVQRRTFQGPVQLPSCPDAVAVYAGDRTSAALLADGRLMVWGGGAPHALGCVTGAGEVGEGTGEGVVGGRRTRTLAPAAADAARKRLALSAEAHTSAPVTVGRVRRALAAAALAGKGGGVVVLCEGEGEGEGEEGGHAGPPLVLLAEEVVQDPESLADLDLATSFVAVEGAANGRVFWVGGRRTEAAHTVRQQEEGVPPPLPPAVEAVEDDESHARPTTLDVGAITFHSVAGAAGVAATGISPSLSHAGVVTDIVGGAGEAFPVAERTEAGEMTRQTGEAEGVGDHAKVDMDAAQAEGSAAPAAGGAQEWAGGPSPRPSLLDRVALALTSCLCCCSGRGRKRGKGRASATVYAEGEATVHAEGEE